MNQITDRVETRAGKRITKSAGIEKERKEMLYLTPGNYAASALEKRSRKRKKRKRTAGEKKGDKI